MLFKVEGVTSKRHTHCGVLEFIAEEGVIYMPHWVRRVLCYPDRQGKARAPKLQLATEPVLPCTEGYGRHVHRAVRGTQALTQTSCRASVQSTLG